MPMGPPSQVPDPKSGCSGAPAPIAAMIAAESLATGSEAIGVRQTLSAGATAHRGAPPSAAAGGWAAPEVTGTSADATTAATVAAASTRTEGLTPARHP